MKASGAGSKIPLVARFGLAALIMVGVGATVAQKPTPLQHHLDPPLYTQDLTFHDKTLEQKVRILVDREEIRDLIATYAHRVAHGIPQYDLFTEDGTFTIRRLPDESVDTVTGIEAMKKRAGRLREPNTSPIHSPDSERALPMIHNFLIRIEGDNAWGINSNELRITENGKSMIASGYYEDVYRRVNGKWKFVRRDTTFIHHVPIQQGWARPVESK